MDSGQGYLSHALGARFIGIGARADSSPGGLVAVEDRVADR